MRPRRVTQTSLDEQKQPTRKRWLRVVCYPAIVVVVLYLVTVVLIGNRLIAPAGHVVTRPESQLLIEDVKFASGTGAKIAGWWIPADDSRGTIILCHGIRGDRLTMFSRADFLQAAGYSILLIDLQAHGESSGANVTAGHKERNDVEAAVAYVRGRTAGPIAIVGWSLGGAATVLAHDLQVDAVVLESVYPTIGQAIYNRVYAKLGWFADVPAKSLMTYFEWRLGVSEDDLRPIDRIGGLNCPVLIMNGDADLHTTATEAERMYAAASEPKKLVLVLGAGHVDLHAFNTKQYEREVLTFLDTHLPLVE